MRYPPNMESVLEAATGESPMERFAPAGNGHANGKLPMDPVFVLCMGRSGSTLLRLILDTHPDLACPPETNIPALCSTLTGASSGPRGHGPRFSAAG
jgi:hypothetical protein